MKASREIVRSKFRHMFSVSNKRKFAIILAFVLLSFSLSAGLPVQASEDAQDEHAIIPGQNSNSELEIFQNLSSSSVVPTDELDIVHEEEAFDGYNLLVLQRMEEETRYKELYLVIMDMEGNVVAEKRLGANFYLADCPAEWINATAILYGTPEGAVIWDYYRDTTVELDFRGHHEYEYNHVNDTIFTFEYEFVEIEGEEYLFDRIVEYNLTGDVVWALDTTDFVSPTQGCPFNDTFYQRPDITHSNTVFFDEDYNVIYYNARNLNTFYEIDHSNSEILWAVGEYGNFTLYNQSGVEREALFYHAHAVEKIDTNRFIIFDNDYHDQENPLTKQSRILEIAVDEDAETATVVWSWEPSIEYWSRIWGDADRLPNGNSLGVFGTRGHPYSSASARLVEVDEDGNIVWKIDFPQGAGYSYGVYRIERFRFAPSIDYPDTVRFTADDNATIDLKACYNFKPKRDVMGTYEVYLDGNLTSSGSITYDRYWRYRGQIIELGELAPDSYNLTLSISDEAGHNTTKAVDLIISSSINQFVIPVIALACIIGILSLVVAVYKGDYFAGHIDKGS